jgi:streptomycin 6-kinase
VIDIPARLRHLEAAHPNGATWLAELPELFDRSLSGFGVHASGRAYADSYVSLVVPVTDGRGADAVLKIQFPHPECQHEAAALARWDGDGAVRLLDHAPELHALLIERCVPGDHLSGRDPGEALEVLIRLLPRLWKAAGEPFRPLAVEAQEWVRGLPDRWQRAGEPFERLVLDTAIDTLRSLAASQPQHEAVLLHQDLHASNVLHAKREPWLAIDPKPLIGERAFSVAPIVRDYDLGHTQAAVEQRLARLVTSLGLDRDRAWGWAFGQTVAWSFEGEGALAQHLDTARWLLELR